MERFIKNLARGAGKILRDGFKRKFKINTKTAHYDVVTKYDLAAEDFLVKKIKSKYPIHGILSEESGQISTGKSFWILDPIDGTLGFSRGLPQFAVLISWVHKNRIKYSVVYDPIYEELFFAEDKKGAYLNGKKISVSKLEVFKYLDVVLGFGSGRVKFEERKKVFDRLVLKHDWWLVGTTSIGLSSAYVANGRFDLIISKGLSPWDYSAPGLVLKEAGATITDFEGKPYRWNSKGIIAANPVLHQKIMTELKGKRK